MRQGRENPVDRAIWILEAALNDIIIIVEKMADEEEWTPARRQERLQEICEQVEALIRSARDIRRDTANATLVTQARSLTGKVVESA
jgi:hypothetical protein